MPRFIPITIEIQDSKATPRVKVLKNAFDDLDKTTEHTSRGLQNAFLKADLLSRGIARGLADIKQQLAEGVQEYRTYNRELANLNTLLDDDRSIEKFRTGLLNLDPALGKSSELARGMYQAISSGVDAGDGLQFITASAKAARAGLASTFETVDAGTSVMASFGLKGSEITTVYDKMFETVKRGKVEMPQLAQSIGLVTNIAAQTGVTLDEMFAVIATGSRTVRPQVLIEGFRTALANILKPSEQALEVARRLNVEFSAEALQKKGFAQFLTDVSTAAKGNKEDLARLFGDVQALNAVMAITGNQAQTFADDLKGIARASGTVEEAFQKQKQSIDSQLEQLQTTVFQGLAKGLTVLEPITIQVLKLVNQFPAVFGAAAVALGALTLASVIYNTQIGFTAATQIPAVIKGIKDVIFWMVNWRVAITDTQTLMTALTGYLGLAAIAIGALIYLIASYKSAADKANAVTQEQIDLQVKELNQSKALAEEFNRVASAQLINTQNHEKLNGILNQLDPATVAYVKALHGEENQIKLINQELKKTLELKRQSLQAEFIVVAAGIVQQTNNIKNASGDVEKLNADIRDLNQTVANGGGLLGKNYRNQEIVMFSNDVSKLNDYIKDQNKELDRNYLKLFVIGQALNLDRDQMTALFRTAGAGEAQLPALIQKFEQLTNAQRDNAQATKQTTNAVDEQTDALKRLKEIQQQMTARKERIDAATLEIIENAKNAAEARRQVNDLRKNNAEFKKDLEDQRRVDQNKRAVDKLINPPSESTSGTSDRLVSTLVKSSLGLGPVTPKDPKLAAMIRAYAGTFGIPLWVAFAQLYTESAGYSSSVISGKTLSPQGAIGLSQVMPGTAQQYGFSTGSLKTPEGALTAWGKIMTDLFRRYGDWQLAILAYHQGPGTVDKLKAMLERHSRGEISDNQAEVAYQKIIGPKGRAYLGTISSYEQSASQVKAGELPDLPGSVKLLLDDIRRQQQQAPLATSSTRARLEPATLTADERYVQEQKQALDYEKQLTDAVLRRRNLQSEMARDYERDTLDLINIETDLMKIRRQATDDQFNEQRRLLSVRGEERDLLLRIRDAEDELANSPYNESLRIQLALLEDIIDIRRRDEDAIKAQNRAQLELADGDIFHAEQARAKVLDHLARSRSETEVFADAIIDAYEGINDVVLKGVQKITGGIKILDNLIAGLVTRLTDRLFQKLLDVLIPSGQGAGGGGGGGILNLLGRGGGGGGGAGSLIQLASGGGIGGGVGGVTQLLSGGLLAGGSLSVPSSLTSQLAQQQALGTVIHEAGHSAGTAAAAGALAPAGPGLLASLGAALPFLGAGIGAQAGGKSLTGQILGGAGGLIPGGIGAAFLAPGLFATTGVLGSFGPAIAGLLTNPFTAIAAGALIIGAIALSKNAARRRDEKTRNQSMLDSLGQLNEILRAVKSDRMDGGAAIAAAAQIRSQYLEQMNQLKDGKTKRIALADVSRLDVIINQIRNESNAQLKRQEIDRKLVPEFASGSDRGLVPYLGGMQTLIKVRPGERIDDVGMAQSFFVPGVDRGVDSVYTVATPGSRVLTKQQQPRVPAFANGTPAALPAAEGDRPIAFTVNINLPGMKPGVLAEQIVKSPEGREAIVKLVQIENRDGRFN